MNFSNESQTDPVNPKAETENMHSTDSSHHHSHRHHLTEEERRREKKREKRRKKKRKIKAFLKKNGLQLLCLAILLIVLSVLIFIAANKTFSPEEAQNSTPQNSAVGESTQLRLGASFFTEEIPLVNEATRAYLASDLSENVSDVLSAFRTSDKFLDDGLCVTLDFSVDGIPAGYFVDSSKVEIDEDPAFSAPRVIELSGEKRSVDVYYLKTGTQYYYRITVRLSDGSSPAISGSFKTADTPRILSIEGLVNVRDIGGWKTVSGKTVRQGLLFRGSELDGAVEPGYDLTENGLIDALTVLGIRTDLDLRDAADNTENTHALGANVRHKYYDVVMYEGIFVEGEGEKIRAVFSDLANEDNYPIYLHCTYGQDRTGTICYLLEALLGLEEEDLIREYELSALRHEATDASLLTTFVDRLKTYEGRTLQEKTEQYLLSVGVTEQEISSIRNIFLS